MCNSTHRIVSPPPGPEEGVWGGGGYTQNKRESYGKLLLSWSQFKKKYFFFPSFGFAHVMQLFGSFNFLIHIILRMTNWPNNFKCRKKKPTIFFLLILLHFISFTNLMFSTAFQMSFVVCCFISMIRSKFEQMRYFIARCPLLKNNNKSSCKINRKRKEIRSYYDRSWVWNACAPNAKMDTHTHKKITQNNNDSTIRKNSGLMSFLVFGVHNKLTHYYDCGPINNVLHDREREKSKLIQLNWMKWREIKRTTQKKQNWANQTTYLSVYLLR